MRKRNRALAMLLALVMAFGLTGAAFAAEEGGKEYTDVPGWAKEYVDEMTEQGLIDGKTDTTFGAGDRPVPPGRLPHAARREGGVPLPGRGGGQRVFRRRGVGL